MVIFTLSDLYSIINKCRRRGDCMVVGFTTACAISAYHY